MNCQFLFHWPSKLFTYYGDLSDLYKNETLNEIKTSQENLWQRTIQLSDFSNTHWCSFPNGSVWLELVESAAARVVLLQLLIYTRWSSRRWGLGWHVPMGLSTVEGTHSRLSVPKQNVLLMLPFTTNWTTGHLRFLNPWSFCTVVIAWGESVTVVESVHTVFEAAVHDTYSNYHYVGCKHCETRRWRIQNKPSQSNSSVRNSKQYSSDA